MKLLKALNHFLIYLFLGFMLGACQSNTTVHQIGAPKSDKLASPYNSASVHLYYLEPHSYEPDTAAMVFQEAPKKSKELAVKLKAIFDGKGLIMPFNSIPRSNDFLDSLTNQHIYTPFPVELPKIYFERIGEEWLYSKQSALIIPEIHAEIYTFPVRAFQKIFSFSKLGSLDKSVRSLIGALLLMLFSYFIFHLIRLIFNFFVRKIANAYIQKGAFTALNIRSVTRTIALIISISVLVTLVPALEFGAVFSALLIKGFKIFKVALFVILGFYITEVIIRYFKTLTGRTANKMDDQLVPIINRTIQVFIIGIGLFQICGILNINITALIAGISIGSLAIALAAQDTIKNLFGSATIFIDKPFQIGDWIHFDGIDGTVEEVGFRSTRIRTFENSLVSIPNGNLADGVINNYGLRIYRRYKTELSVTYDTPADLLEVFIDGLKKLAATNPKISNGNTQICLIGLEESSLNILVYIFLDVADWSEELKVREELLLSIIRLAKSLEIRFAFPSRALYIEDFPEKKSLIPNYNEKKYYESKKDAFFINRK